MRVKKKSATNFMMVYILPIMTYLIVLTTLYISISRILLWEILVPFMNANLHRILSLFFLSHLNVQVNRGALALGLCRFVIIAGLLLLAIRIKYLRQWAFWLRSLALLAVLLISGLSSYWSVVPGITIGRFYYFLAVTIGSVYIALELKKPRIMWILEIFAVLMVLGNIIMVYKYPANAILGGSLSGPWRGLFWYKLYAGEMMVFAATMFLFRVINFKQERWPIRIYSIFFYGLSIFVLLKSQTAMGLISLLAVHLLLLLAILYLKWGHLLRPVHKWVIGAFGLLALLAAWFGRGIWLGFFGRESTLTGRIPLWTTLIPYVKEKLFFGYGYGEAFWKVTENLQKIWAVFNWHPAYAHNAYLELILDMGIVGFVIWVFFLIYVLYLSLKYFFRERTLPALIFLAWSVAIVVYNLSDNLLGSYETFYWSLLVIAFTCLIRDILDRSRLNSTKSP